MKADTARTLRAFVIELAIYSGLVLIYFLAVLHFLANWLYQLELHHRYTYAGVAILLVVGQAILLDAVTAILLRIIRGRVH